MAGHISDLPSMYCLTACCMQIVALQAALAAGLAIARTWSTSRCGWWISTTSSSSSKLAKGHMAG